MNIELTDEQAEVIVPAGLDFIRTLTDQLGPDAGLLAWDNIVETFGNDIRGKVFFAMLMDTSAGTMVSLKNFKPTTDPNSSYSVATNIVPAIKLIREYTGMGLKESKDIVDDLRMGKQHRIKIRDWRTRYKFIIEAKNLGLHCI